MDEYDEYTLAEDPELVTGLLDEAALRAGALGSGRRPWTTATGSVVRGYVSRVDGSIQPYVVEIPAGLDRSKPARPRRPPRPERRYERGPLHPSRISASRSRPNDLYLTLHVFGRGNNAYRWAGETDVFEAIDAVRRNEKVDDDRVVLRGFSMGGAGAWHLGLHYPSSWCSVEAGAGFTETIRYAGLEDKPLPGWAQEGAHDLRQRRLRPQHLRCPRYRLRRRGRPATPGLDEHHRHAQVGGRRIQGRRSRRDRRGARLPPSRGGKGMGHKIDPGEPDHPGRVSRRSCEDRPESDTATYPVRDVHAGL